MTEVDSSTNPLNSSNGNNGSSIPHSTDVAATSTSGAGAGTSAETLTSVHTINSSKSESGSGNNNSGSSGIGSGINIGRSAQPTSQIQPPRLIFANPPPDDDLQPPHHHLHSSLAHSIDHRQPLHHNSHYHHPHHLPDLRLQTDVVAMSSSTNNAKSIPVPSSTRASAAALSRSNSFQSSLSPNSATGSPSITGFLSEITPLPSPVISADSPGPWRLFRNGSLSSRPTSRGSIASLSINDQGEHGAGGGGSDSMPVGVGRSPSKRKLYQGLNHIDAPSAHDYRLHQSTPRSVSEQVTKLDVPAISRQSQTEDGNSESKDASSSSSTSHPFKREEHLAGKHGQQRTRSTADLQVPVIVDGVSDYRIPEDGSIVREIFTATTYPGNNIRRWRAVRLLGQGTFSKVMLATLELKKNTDSEAELDRDKLVAVKIVENTAAGGASRARIESSLKRELDILKSLKHPSLVHLKAQSIERKRALLILGYCAGGDLFDLATSAPKLLTPKFVRRIFSELVGAVRYLHLSGIVHRDIKLENVLINFTAEELAQSGDEIIASNRSITTLTDLGLSRRIDFDEPLLTTRCGSEDYAAPELLLGQPYDGRHTDAWALGVLLYAICESRLPFDPVPGANEHKMRSRTAHRIARCDWKWFKLADTPPPVAEEGSAAADAEGELSIKEPYDPDWNPAKVVVDGLLKRVKKRLPLEEVEKMEWVQGAITVPLEDPPSTEELEEESESS
ncbi:hypothetical protein AOL_s00043g600 [Orbilia oligospora ATCC 24927]|uniref:Protein kinase domain-containing protein n=1 Tax=Arthrobotrys oligospora (strain ATCC 24927 / CBS 115.81 / DSM 1491) TaxID=756982 RepID=G1X4H6_ARTOA|nr:hypothetical protein AOL_s00043g600 [Orbilia oligospora ATCC 24927]EGX51866.1 hypothetical protein AOL_s00043g600 [Orbilia oligospora ATCC 24927]